MSSSERCIGPANLPHRELLDKRVIRPRTACADQDAAGPPVEPVHDAGPAGLTHAGHVRILLDQCVCERARRVPAARMCDDSGWLVHDHDVAIGMQDIERGNLTALLRDCGGKLHVCDFYSRAGSNPYRARPSDLAVDQNAPLSNHLRRV
nr:hypothetical protein [Candidatus Poriferisodalis multihospitum]